MAAQQFDQRPAEPARMLGGDDETPQHGLGHIGCPTSSSTRALAGTQHAQILKPPVAKREFGVGDQFQDLLRPPRREQDLGSLSPSAPDLTRVREPQPWRGTIPTAPTRPGPAAW
ncbi:hypothetical protein [Streptomyces sp. SudanB182_2057]|uniref:hypothetical protein n=1 Tax=Streptomyces sp. SudanB182_2057 TaxID=3035281 RepID=UPI003F568225